MPSSSTSSSSSPNRSSTSSAPSVEEPSSPPVHLARTRKAHRADVGHHNVALESSRGDDDALTMLHKLERLLQRASIEGAHTPEPTDDGDVSPMRKFVSPPRHRGGPASSPTSSVSSAEEDAPLRGGPPHPLTPPRTREVLHAAEKSYYQDPNISLNEHSLLHKSIHHNTSAAHNYDVGAASSYYAHRPASHSRYLYLLPGSASTTSRHRSPPRPKARKVGNLDVAELPHRPRNIPSHHAGNNGVADPATGASKVLSPTRSRPSQHDFPASKAHRHDVAKAHALKESSPYAPFAVPSMMREMSARVTAADKSNTVYRAGGAPHLTTSQRDLITHQARELEELRQAVLSYSDLLHEAKQNYAVKEKEVLLLTKQRAEAKADVERWGFKYTKLQSRHGQEVRALEGVIAALKVQVEKQTASISDREMAASTERLARIEAKGDASSLRERLISVEQELSVVSKERDALAKAVVKRDKVGMDQRRQLVALRKVLSSLKDFAPSRELRTAIAAAVQLGYESDDDGVVASIPSAPHIVSMTPPRHRSLSTTNYNRFDPPYPSSGKSSPKPCRHAQDSAN